MRLRRPSPFVDLVERQLTIFAQEQAVLLADIEVALAAYDAASADEAEERYGDYVDLVETAQEALETLRNTYANTLEADADTEYRHVYLRLAQKRFPRIPLEAD